MFLLTFFFNFLVHWCAPNTDLRTSQVISITFGCIGLLVITALVLPVDVYRVLTFHRVYLTLKGGGYLHCVLLFIHSEFDWTMAPLEVLSWMATSTFRIPILVCVILVCGVSWSRTAPKWNNK
jgi:hypothetical protein